MLQNSTLIQIVFNMYYYAVIVVIKRMHLIKIVDGYLSLMFPWYAVVFTFDVVTADTTYSI